jgi:hypothetical protein
MVNVDVSIVPIAAPLKAVMPRQMRQHVAGSYPDCGRTSFPPVMNWTVARSIRQTRRHE